MELTSRERILRTYRRQEIDRIPLVDYPWKGTLRRWYREGLPQGVEWQDHFGYDRVVQLHSCGYIEKLLPDILETGVDMLNPLEVKAGMDPARLKNLYGDKLAFRGGINAQLWDQMDLVKAEMERIIPVMKEGGGYIFASDHSIPNSVSFANMTEITALAKKLGKY